MNPRVRIVVPAVLGSLLGLTAIPAAGANPGDSLSRINHIVVIYEENHSFDNLYGDWEGVNGRANADAAHTLQIKQDGTTFNCLLQNDVNLTSPPPASCSDTTGTLPANTSTAFTSHFSNAPFSIEAYIPKDARTCPQPGVFAPNGLTPNPANLQGGCTEDIVHRYYQEQYQLNNGHQNRYTNGSDAVGLTQGYYNTRDLPIYQYLHGEDHPKYAIADNFFQAAFGGSFLNHQWLVAAATPLFAGALNDGSADDRHSVVDANGMPINYPLYKSPLGANGGAANPPGPRDSQLTASCNPPAPRPATPAGVVCGDWAVNTTQPTYQPYAPGTPAARRLLPLSTPNIGDALSAHGVDWAWYSGGWDNADGRTTSPYWSNGPGPNCSDPNTIAGATYPNCPDKVFQFHHQPLNYFATYAPGTTARANHLRDEQEFIALGTSSSSRCNLKPVSFIKPIGLENEHPGYTSESRGSDHLVQLLQTIEGSACRKDTMVVVTYDEFGGQWDHVAPPGQGGTAGPHDQWGPGTRIPTLVVSPFLHGEFVLDSTSHDTTSILATIEHRFGLAPLGTRDAAVNDLSSVFGAKQVGD
jgi:acid phosphatase